MDRSLWLEVYVHILYIYNGMCAYIIYICISPCAKVQHTHTQKQFLRPQSGSFGTGMTIAKQIERDHSF